MPTNRLAALAVALAGLAAVLLPIAVVRRCRGGGEETAAVPVGPGSGSADGFVPAPAPQSLIDATIATMFGAMCRHQVKCGIGTVDRCDYVEATMKQMPKSLAVRPCTQLDPLEARRCVEDIAARSCDDFAKSLDVLDLQRALDRIRSCRLACE